MSTVVVANAPLTWTQELTAIATTATQLVAADGGADALARIGLRPQAVVGDLDSIGQTTRQWLGGQVLHHQPSQDHTDLEKTLSYVFDELSPVQVIVLGALGGRIDHTMHNLGLLARYACGPSLVLREAQEEIVAVTGEASLPARPGETWSFWTFDPAVRVTLAGVRWPVSRCRLDLLAQPSTSNEAASGQVRIMSEGGATLARRQLV